MARPVYADHAATSYPCLFPPLPEEQWANASSGHALGRAAQDALATERARVERLLNAPAAEAPTSSGPRVIFTSGGTEGDNLVLQGYPWDFIVTTATEHPAVHLTVQLLAARRGVHVEWLPLDAAGRISAADVEAAVRRRPPGARGLVTLMYVNNEIGTVHDLAAVAAAVRRCNEDSPPVAAEPEGEAPTGTRGHRRLAPPRVAFHTDAVQAPGHVPLDVAAMGVDFLTLGAHKFHGPTGIGILYCREPAWLQPLLIGGHQQGGLRPGTEPVALVRAMGRALEDACGPLWAPRAARLERWTRRIWQSLAPFIVAGLVRPTGPTGLDRRDRAPHHVSFCVRGARREHLVSRLEAAGCLVSGGSACTHGSDLPSHVLAALGVPADFIRGSVRITLSHTNTWEEIDGRLCPALERVLHDVLAGRGTP